MENSAWIDYELSIIWLSWNIGHLIQKLVEIIGWYQWGPLRAGRGWWGLFPWSSRFPGWGQNRRVWGRPIRLPCIFFVSGLTNQRPFLSYVVICKSVLVQFLNTMVSKLISVSAVYGCNYYKHQKGENVRFLGCQKMLIRKLAIKLNFQLVQCFNNCPILFRME